MALSELCIRRPALTTLLTASLVALGLLAYRLLPVSAMPSIDYPTIVVTATLPGASPETMSATVVAPLERQLSLISGINSIKSLATTGTVETTIAFDLGRNIDSAALDVQTALINAKSTLPIEMTQMPTFQKLNPAERPVIFLALKSGTQPLSIVNEYAETIVQRQLTQISGVAQVQVWGGQKYSVRVQIDPEAAAARGISLEEIRNTITKANSSLPVGTLVGPRENVMLEANGQLERAADYGNLVVAWRNGAPIRLGEVARVIDSVEQNRNAAWFKSERSIFLVIKRQSGANSIEVSNAVRAALPGLRAQIPASISLEVDFDRSVGVRQATLDVYETMLIAIGLVVLVIFLFLRSASATVIPALAVPISLVATCAAMYAFGFSINNITLLALTLSIGFVVDDAIVMLENIMRHVEEGMRPFEAALVGAREIGFTVISITVSLIAVFIPVLFMGDVIGRIFREFAVTISVAIVVSGIVALTMIPMLCARVLRKPREGTRQNIVFRSFERMFQRWLAAYEWSLDRVLRFKAITLLVTVATIAGTVWLYIAIPKDLIPQEDTGYVSVETEGPAAASFDAMLERQQKLAAIVRADRAVESVSVFVDNTNLAYLDVQLKPKGERDAASVVFERLKVAAKEVPGIKIEFESVQNITLGISSGGKHKYTLRSGNVDSLYRIVPEMQSRLSRVKGLQDVDNDLRVGPQIKISIDREKAAVYGITMEQVRQELYNAYGSRQISTIYTPATGYQVIIETLPEMQSDSTQLSRVRLKTAGGQTIPLDAVARLVPGTAPMRVNHLSQRPAATISFNLAPGTSLDRAIAEIQKVERELPLPVTVTSTFEGAAQIFKDGAAGQWLLILAAIFATYVVLGILYESFIHPITIISGLPSAGIGALLALMLFNMELTVISMIGVIMLVGIVKKNAIMMVDFAIERRRVGLSADAAIREACLLRFRPIMMTTMAAILGTLPIALGNGAGAEMRQPLGIAVVGGLLLSQLLTLYITPVVYLYLDRIDRKVRHSIEPQLDIVPPAPAPEPVRAIAAE